MRGWIGVTGLLLCLAGCGESFEVIPTYLFFGTVTSTSVAASGGEALLRLVEPGGDWQSVTLFKAACRIVGPACDFQINAVTEGEYSVLGMIDRNANAASADPVPDAGDLIAPARPLLMYDRQRMDFPDEAWHESP